MSERITEYSNEAQIHTWATFVCKSCKVGFQVESINALGMVRAAIKCPFCQSNDLEQIEWRVMHNDDK